LIILSDYFSLFGYGYIVCRLSSGKLPPSGEVMDTSFNYRRVLLKLSGEALMGEKEFGLDPTTAEKLAKEIKLVHMKGIQICLVIGGGNIFRGVSLQSSKIERATADHMGMLATVLNALAMQSILEAMGINTRVMSAIPMTTVCEPYIRRRASRHLEKNRIVIFAAGTGNPFFTTDTAAALRAIEMNCDVLLKGTQVDGVYDADPKKVQNARRFSSLTYQDAISKNLKIMDTAAIALARENTLPILVFSIHDKGQFADIIDGQGHYTIVKESI